MENIDEKINKLGEEERQIFSDRLMDNLHNREWCRRHRINYDDPHILTVKERTYIRLFENKTETQKANLKKLIESGYDDTGIRFGTENPYRVFKQNNHRVIYDPNHDKIIAEYEI